MKKRLLIISMIFASILANAQLLIEDNFDYGESNGSLVDVSDSLWIKHSGVSTLDYQALSGLSFTGYSGSSVGGAAFVNSSSNTEDLNREFTPQTSGVIYASAIINVTDLNADNYFMHFMTGSTSFYGRLHATDDAGSLKLGIRKSTNSTIVYSPDNYNYNTTYVVVIKYDFSSEEAHLFVLDAIAYTEPAPNAISNDGTINITTIDKIALRQSLSSGAYVDAYVDGIRVANTWEDLFPNLAGVLPAVAFTSATRSRDENNTANDSLFINLSEVATRTDSVYVSAIDGSAIYGSDYTTTPNLSAGHMFEVNAGDSTVLIIVNTIDNAIYEGNKNFTLRIDSVSDSLTVGTTPELTYTIIEDEISTNPIIEFTTASYSKTEGDAPFLIDISLAPTATVTDTIWIEVVNGTGVTYADDYTIDSTIVNDTFMIIINNGDNSTGFNFSVIDDAIVEANEKVTFNIVALSGDLVFGSTLSTEVTIIDNDVPPVVFIPISEIQTPGMGSDSSLYTGQTVITGGIVTAVKAGTGYWIQESNGGEFSGIYVFDNANTPAEGDSVVLEADVDEFFSSTQLENITSFTVVSSGNSYVITELTTTEVNQEEYESVMVSVSNVIVTDIALGFGQYQINDNSGATIVDDFIFFYTLPALNDTLDITGVVGYSFGEFKIYPRDDNDVVVVGETEGPDQDATNNCTGATVNETYIFKDFEDLSLTSNGWTNVVVTGTTNWGVGSFSGENYARVSNFSGGANSEAEVWLISPSVNLAASSAPVLNFITLAKFDGDPLQLMISTDYSGTGNPNNATWDDITASAEWDEDFADWGDWVCSGDIGLSNYKEASVHIGFKYIGSNSDGTTWEVDDIALFDGDGLSVEKAIENVVEVYPNPANDILNIALENNNNTKINIIDITGKTVLTQELKAQNNIISVQNLESGLYFVEISTQNKTDRIKFIKK